MLKEHIKNHLIHTANDQRSVFLRLRGIAPELNANTGADAVDVAKIETAIARAGEALEALQSLVGDDPVGPQEQKELVGAGAPAGGTETNPTTGSAAGDEGKEGTKGSSKK